MRIIEAVNGSPIYVGHQLDNETTKVEFDIYPIYDLYGEGGTFSIYVQRYGEPDGYPVGVPYIEVSNGYLFWTLTSADVAIAGENECQVRYVKDGKVVMSLLYKYIVQRSIVLGDTVPAPMQEWADEIVNAAAEVVPMPEDMVRVPTASSLGTILGVSDGEVKQTDIDNIRPSWLPAPIAFIKKHIAANATVYLDLIGDGGNGAKALMLIFGSTANNRVISMINEQSNGVTTQLVYTTGDSPVALVCDSTDANAHTAHCHITNGANYSYVYFVVFNGEITFPT